MISTMRTALITGLFVAVAAIASHAQGDGEARMRSWAVALGVECAHCHVPDRWMDASKPAYAFAQRMMRMVSGLNEGPLKGVGTVTCWTCHRGRPIPARVPGTDWQRIQAEHETEFATQPDQALGMSIYAASLGVDCSYCHEADRAANTKAPKTMVARMLPIFDEIPKYFGDSRKPVTQCYMCHQGKTKPER